MFDRLRNTVASLLNRTGTAAATAGAYVSAVAGDLGKEDPAWILGNPLRGLTPERAAGMLDAWVRGEYKECQWLFYYVEHLDADVLTLANRRVSSIKELTYTIRVNQELAEELGQEPLAEQQQAALEARYEAIENLSEGIGHLATAFMRAFALVSIQGNRLEPINQWWWLRRGMFGAWHHNPTLAYNTARTMAAESAIDESQYLIRECERSMFWIAILKFIRANKGQKWWDKFCEVASKNGTVIIGPPTLADAQVATFKTDARAIADGGSGVLPNGCTVIPTGPQRQGPAPYKDHLQALREQVVLAGTGGLLTMLAAPTGLGSGVSGEHADVFRTLRNSDAADIASELRKKIDGPLLRAQFPGQPVLAYFELDTAEDTSPAAYLDDAVKAKQAGFQMDADQLSEKTGYTLTLAPIPSSVIPSSVLPLQNRRHAGVLANAAPSAYSLQPTASPASIAQADLKRLEAAVLKEFGPAYAEQLKPLLAQTYPTMDAQAAALQDFAVAAEVKARMADVIGRAALAADLRGRLGLSAASVELQPVPFSEALDFWAKKIPQDAAGKALMDQLGATVAQAQAYGLKVAGITETSTLNQIKADLQQAIAGQTTVDEFVRNAQLDYGLGAKHAETVVRTNVQTAFQYGHYQRLDSIREQMPIWAFDVVLDDRTSTTCRPLHGLAYPADHPIWNSLYPPNHFNCRTTIVAFESPEAAAAQGFRVVDAWPRDKGTGAYYMPAQGFQSNVGAVPSLDSILPE